MVGSMRQSDVCEEIGVRLGLHSLDASETIKRPIVNVALLHETSSNLETNPVALISLKEKRQHHLK